MIIVTNAVMLTVRLNPKGYYVNESITVSYIISIISQQILSSIILNIIGMILIL